MSDVVFKNTMHDIAYVERRYKKAFARRAALHVAIALLIIVMSVVVTAAVVVNYA